MRAGEHYATYSGTELCHLQEAFYGKDKNTEDVEMTVSNSCDTSGLLYKSLLIVMVNVQYIALIPNGKTIAIVP